jgi:hypothetical protein
MVRYDFVACYVEKRAEKGEFVATMFPILKNSSILLDTFRFALLSIEGANQYRIASFFDPDSPRFLPLKLESEPVFISASGHERNEFSIVCRGAIVNRSFTVGDEIVEVADGEPYLSPFMFGDRVLSVLGGRAPLVSDHRLYDLDPDDLGKFVVWEMAGVARPSRYFTNEGSLSAASRRIACWVPGVASDAVPTLRCR